MSREGHGGTRTHVGSKNAGLQIFVWTLILALLGLPLYAGFGPWFAAVWYSLTSLVVGSAAFVLHGAGRITVLGLFNLASGLFVGLGALMGMADGFVVVPPGYLVLAVGGSLVSMAGITLVCWTPCQPTKFPQENFALDGPTSMVLVVAGIGMYAGATMFQVLELVGPISYLAEGFAYVGIVTFAVGALFRQNARLTSFATLLIGGLVILYATVNHSGTGRLRIVALACSIALLLAYRFPRSRIKAGIIAMIPVALWVLALVRLNYQETLSAGASEGRSGLESMISPIVTLADTLYAQSLGWSLRGGRTFFSFVFIGTPPESEPDWAPEALGYDLLYLTDPDRVGSGDSRAVTVFGEGVWNFGLIGFVAIIPIAALVIWVLDRYIWRCTSKLNSSSVLSIMGLVFIVSAAGSIGDFSWNGLHTFLSRVFTRVPGVALLSVLLLAVSISKPPISRGRGGSGWEVRASSYRDVWSA